MHFYDTFLACYGWEGAALAGAMLVMLGVQLYYYIGVYGRIAGYRDSRRAATAARSHPSRSWCRSSPRTTVSSRSACR